MDQLERIGKYQVVRPLGQGGFGEVFLVRHPELAVLRAVKMLRYGTEGRKLEEAVLQAQLEHERIVRCMDVGQQDGRPYLVMEYLPGGSLEDLLADGPLEVSRALAIGRDVSLALAHAHAQNVIHRDLKPANVLLTQQGRAKIADFGLARLLDQGPKHHTKVAGTVCYLAPEQLGGEANPQSDLWALGCLMYEMISGQPPFLGSGDYQTMKAIAEGDPQPLEAPPEVTQLVSDLLSKDPAQRPANAEEVARRLARLAAPGTDAAPRRVGPVTMESDDWPTLGGDPGRTSSKLAALGDQLAELWRWQAPGAIVSPAALCRGRVFFTTVDGLVLCLDLLSGKLLWRHDCGVNAFPAPVAMGTACLAVSYDGTVHALSAFDGAVLWQVRPGGAIGTSPLMCPAGVAVADVDGGVYLLDPANGDTRAYWDLGAAVEASPLFTDDLLVAATMEGQVAALDPGDGEAVWSLELGQPVEAAPAASQGAVFLLGRQGDLWCVDGASGAERWRVQVGAPTVAAPVVDDQGILVVDLHGGVTHLDPASGQHSWQRRLSAPLSAAAAAAGSLAVAADRGGCLVVLERSEGREVTRVDLGAPLAASPVVWREVVIAVSTDGMVCALGQGE